MILTYRPIKVWPEGWDPDHWDREANPFNSTWSHTLNQLDGELEKLGATNPTLQLAITERDCRLDGQLRSDARVRFPGVILSFGTTKHGTLTYACDRFGPALWKRNGLPGWQANVRAITLGLESLRRVERYGIADRGQQYAGWAELPRGIPLSAPMTVEQAWTILVTDSGLPQTLSGTNEGRITELYRAAAKAHHPDQGGDPETFRRITEARDLLLKETT